MLAIGVYYVKRAFLCAPATTRYQREKCAQHKLPPGPAPRPGTVRAGCAVARVRVPAGLEPSREYSAEQLKIPGGLVYIR